MLGATHLDHAAQWGASVYCLWRHAEHFAQSVLASKQVHQVFRLSLEESGDPVREFLTGFVLPYPWDAEAIGNFVRVEFWNVVFHGGQ